MKHPIWAIAISALMLLLTSCKSADDLDKSAGIRSEDAVSTPMIAEDQPRSASVSDPFASGEAAALMEALISSDPEVARLALDVIHGRNDPTFIAVMIELMRAAQIGLVEAADFPQYVETLEYLSGESFGEDWPAWIRWYGAADLEPPPGFTGWKGRLLGRIDPGFALFLRDDTPSNIRVEEITWGGVVVDGIPALDNPAMIPADEARNEGLWNFNEIQRIIQGGIIATI